MSDKFFDEPFDDETLLKLEIYRDYLNEWIPVFLAKKNPITNRINIFDFFSGAGTDSIGTFGSPLIAIDSLNTERYLNNISDKKLIVTLYFNDYSSEYIERLEREIENINFNRDLINIEINCLEFKQAFNSLKGKMKNAANFVFLDQFGVECVDKDIFQELVSMPMTDILFFISSSHFNRFYWHDTFKSVLNISKEELNEKEIRISYKLFGKKKKLIVPISKIDKLHILRFEEEGIENGSIYIYQPEKLKFYDLIKRERTNQIKIERISDFQNVFNLIQSLRKNKL